MREGAPFTEGAARPDPRLAYAAGPTEPPLLDRTIGEDLARTVARVPEREALVVPFQGVRETYADLDRAVDRLALALLALGIEAGDRVGIWSPNRAEWVHLQYATAKVGAILVNVNPAYRAGEVRYVLGQSGCRLLVSAAAYRTSDYRGMVAEVAPELPDLERTVFLDGPEWEELIAAGKGVPPERLRERAARLRPADPVNIQYTSGTTGFPKGATLSHRNILNNAFLVAEGLGYTEADRVCVPVPFYHCFGMVIGNLACTSHGATIVVPCPTFDAEAVLRTVAEERCTSLYGVPTMFVAELAHPLLPELDLSSLRTGIMAGAPCPVDVMRRVRSEMHMEQVQIAYGMTETSPCSTQTAADDPVERRVSTVGRVHPHVEIKVVDPATGGTAERGTPGELCARGYSVMLGYWNDPERTADAIDGAGWMHTGDLAVMDAEGYVTIQGRIDDTIVRGGENVYPREIEEFLRGHPDVEDVQVVGVPDDAYGEEVMAWIRPRREAALDAGGVWRFCEGRIAHFKIPRHVACIEEFPMTVTGKVRKVRLREMAAERLRAEAAERSGGVTREGEAG